MHDPDYRAAQKDWASFVESLTQKIIEVDETVPELPVKDIVFRIYRDVRFSSDQTPYKTVFSAAWSRTGRKGPYAAYYVQIKPNGGSLVVGGVWMPDAQALARIRRAIDRRPRLMKQALLGARLRKEFLGGVPSDERKVVKALAAQNQENALKTKPKVSKTISHVCTLSTSPGMNESHRSIFAQPRFARRVYAAVRFHRFHDPVRASERLHVFIGEGM